LDPESPFDGESDGEGLELALNRAKGALAPRGPAPAKQQHTRSNTSMLGIVGYGARVAIP